MPKAATTIIIDIFIVEFHTNVTIQTGVTSITGTSATATITAVTLANSFIVHSQEAHVGNTDSFNRACIQASFNSTTQIALERRDGGNPDWDVSWFVVESDDDDFATEYIEDSWDTAETGPTAITITAVTLANAFIVCTYEKDENDDDMLDSICNMALTTTTALTWYRNSGTTPGGTGTIGVWVVTAAGTEFNVERFSTDVGAAATSTTQAITEIDQAKAILVSSQNSGFCTWPINSATDGNDVEDWQHTLAFSSNTEVTLQRRANATIDGSNNDIRFEVVEFELVPPGPIGGTLGLTGVGIMLYPILLYGGQ